MRKHKKIVRNYTIHSNRSIFKDGNYIEICSGRYSGKHWSEDFIVIEEESFMVIEGIIKKHYKKYDHFDINNISQTKGVSIISNFREAAEGVLACTGKDIFNLVEYRTDSSPGMLNELIKSKGSIAKMLAGLADYMEKAYEKNEWICVLGARRATNP